jgi:hypothetical protein
MFLFILFFRLLDVTILIKNPNPNMVRLVCLLACGFSSSMLLFLLFLHDAFLSAIARAPRLGLSFEKLVFPQNRPFLKIGSHPIVELEEKGGNARWIKVNTRRHCSLIRNWVEIIVDRVMEMSFPDRLIKKGICNTIGTVHSFKARSTNVH